MSTIRAMHPDLHPQSSGVKLGDATITLESVGETGSTNADLLARVASLSGPVLLVAEHQTAGRGRAGRSWLGKPGASLTFSLAWKFEGSASRLIGLPLAVGVALAETLNALAVPVQLKWPNDVLKDGQKLAGILIETRSVGQATWAVVGIGLNLLLPQELEQDIGRSAAQAPALAQMQRPQLLALLSTALKAMLVEFDACGFGAFQLRWNRLHAWHGQAVAIIDHGQLLHEGHCGGVDELGRLLLETAGGPVKIVSGDVSLRLQ